MDTERFGRVLGVGARHAAKTLVGAVEAAGAPPPHGSKAARAAPTSPVVTSAGSAMPPARVRAATVSGGTASASGGTSSAAPGGTNRRGLAEGGRRFGRAVWEPAARLSGVLWLEVTGLFFGIFVAVAAAAAWRLRGAVHLAPGATNAQAHTELLMAVGMLLLFGYFAVSSFLAASRRSRRR